MNDASIKAQLQAQVKSRDLEDRLSRDIVSFLDRVRSSKFSQPTEPSGPKVVVTETSVGGGLSRTLGTGGAGGSDSGGGDYSGSMVVIS